METKYLAIKMAMYFLYNFPPYREVIHWIYEHQNQCNEQHILDKIEDAFKHTNSSVEAWTRFYLECDDQLRKAFVDYICEVYAQKSMHLSDDEKAALK